MKKVFLSLCVLSLLAVVLPFCNSAKKAAGKMQPKVNYISDIQPLIVMHCTPCHFPPQGRKLPLDSFASVKSNIDDILDRIQKSPTDKGFMPFKHPKLPDSTILVFKQWKEDGLMEK